MPARVVLPRPGRAGEEQVVGGLAPPAGGLEDDAQVLLELALADELVEVARAAGRPRRRAARRRGRRRSAAGSSSSSLMPGPDAGAARPARRGPRPAGWRASARRRRVGVGSREPATGAAATDRRRRGSSVGAARSAPGGAGARLAPRADAMPPAEHRRRAGVGIGVGGHGPQRRDHRAPRRRGAAGRRAGGGGVVAVGQLAQHGEHLVGLVAEAGERLAHVGAGRGAWPAPPGRPPPAPAGHREVELGDVEAGLELDQQAGRGLLADAGHEAQRVEVVVGEHLAQRARRRAPRGWPGPAPARRRGRRAAPRSTTRSSRVRNP